jgi:[amino group carrier protein]-lysine/ornithine hydrolase
MTVETNNPAAFLQDGESLLTELVRVHSPSGQERRAVMHLIDWFSRHGYAAHRDAAGNAVGVLEGAANGGPVREIVLLGHIDTVLGFPSVTIRDGKLYGRGAVDAKGPLVAFATAAALVGPRPGWRIVVVGAVEEEISTSRGARHLTNRRRPDLVVIGEPTGWQRVALGYKGRLLADVTLQRRMSHTAGPAASAAELAFAYWEQVGSRIAALNVGRDRAWDQVQGQLRGFNSSDDGLIDTAELRLGFRLPPHITSEQMQSLLLAADEQAIIRFSGEERAFRGDKNTALVRAFLAAIRAHGGEPNFVLKTGTSDMNVVGPAWGCPILAYGPGDSSLDHTPEEHIVLAEWSRGVMILAQVLRELTGSPPG